MSVFDFLNKQVKRQKPKAISAARLCIIDKDTLDVVQHFSIPPTSSSRCLNYERQHLW